MTHTVHTKDSTLHKGLGLADLPIVDPDKLTCVDERQDDFWA